MVDAGSSRTDNHRTRFLEHHRSEIQSYACDVRNTYSGGPCGAGATYRMYGRLGPGYTILGNPWVLDSSEVEGKVFEAFRFFESGCVSKETLLANFAWELPDVQKLWPAFRDLLFPVRSRHISRVSSAKRRVKEYANAHLAYNFGAAPLIGDLIRIYESLSRLSDHVAWLKKNSGQKTKVVFTSGLRRPTSSTLPARPSAAPTGGGGYWRTVTELRAGFKAWAVITYDVSGLSEIELSARTLMRSFGLNNPAAVLWEAIPYSFVVDWVSNVGQLVERLEVPIALPCVFHDCGYGVWVESTISDYYTTWGKSALLRRTRTRGYSRRPGLPLGISGLSLETPSAKQLVLGLSLLAQKF